MPRLGELGAVLRARLLEDNPRFTVSGFAHDVAIGCGAGNLQILKDALATLPLSIANNMTSRVLEGRLPNAFRIIESVWPRFAGSSGASSPRTSPMSCPPITSVNGERTSPWQVNEGADEPIPYEGSASWTSRQRVGGSELGDSIVGMLDAGGAWRGLPVSFPRGVNRATTAGLRIGGGRLYPRLAGG